MVRFIKNTSTSLAEATEEYQRRILFNEQNQRHINVRYEKNDHSAESIGSNFLFKLTYDKKNPSLWSVTLQSLSPAFTVNTYYFPVKTTQNSLSSTETLSNLTLELIPSTPIPETYSFMQYLLKKIFMPNGKTNLHQLEQLNQTFQETIFFDFQPSSALYKHPKYIFFDLLTSQASLPEPLSKDDRQLMLTYMQIIYATKDNPDLLQQAVNQNDAVENKVFNLDIIKAALELPLRLPDPTPLIITPELQMMLKDYANNRLHNTALAYQWFMETNKQDNDDLANRFFYRWVCAGITLVMITGLCATIAIFIAAMSSLLILPLTLFATGALFFGYEAALLCTNPVDDPHTEKNLAEKSFHDEYSMTDDQEHFASSCILQACYFFELQKPVDPYVDLYADLHVDLSDLDHPDESQSSQISHPPRLSRAASESEINVGLSKWAFFTGESTSVPESLPGIRKSFSFGPLPTSRV